MIATALLHQWVFHALIDKGLEFREGVLFYQRHVANRMMYRKYQTQKFEKYWDDIIKEYTEKAEELQNDHLIQLMVKIDSIPKRVKSYILKNFLKHIFRLCWIQYYRIRKATMIMQSEDPDVPDIDL